MAKYFICEMHPFQFTYVRVCINKLSYVVLSESRRVDGLSDTYVSRVHCTARDWAALTRRDMGVFCGAISRCCFCFRRAGVGHRPSDYRCGGGVCLAVPSVPARLGKGQGAKEIGHNLARERPKFGHNLVRKRHKIFYV